MTIQRGAQFNESSRSYDRTYASQKQRFKHDVTFQTLQRLKEHVSLDLSACLDIGCGQGQVLDYIYRNMASEAAPAQFVGVDMSQVGIEQADKRNPSLTWVIDLYQDFTEYALGYTHGEGFDLIINKGGLTFVDSEDEYRSLLAATRSLLSARGVYLFIQNKSFYDHWMSQRSQYWRKDAIDATIGTFGDPVSFPTDAYHVLLFGSDSSDKNPYPVFTGQDDRPQAVEFGTQGGTERHMVKHSEERLLKLTRYFEFDWSRYIENRMSSKKGRSTDPSWQLIREYSRNDPAVIVPKAVVYTGPDIRQNISHPLLRLLSENCVCSYYPFRLRTSRTLVKHLDSMLAARPAKIVLGFSMDDHALDENFEQTIVDIDEFETRLSWTFRIAARTGVQLVYVKPDADLEGREPQRNLRWDPAITAAYRDCIDILAYRYGVKVVDGDFSAYDFAGRKGKARLAEMVVAEVMN